MGCVNHQCYMILDVSMWSLRPLIPAKFSRLCDSDYLVFATRSCRCLLGFQERTNGLVITFVHHRTNAKLYIDMLFKLYYR